MGAMENNLLIFNDLFIFISGANELALYRL
jgi:hypothetical protein